MVSLLKQWLRDRKARQREESYSRGYNFAAGALLRGEETPASLEAQIWPDHDNGPLDAFDRGVMDAVRALVRHKVVEDNSVA